VANSDSIKIAGGAKVLVSPERETDREFVLEEIRKSMRRLSPMDRHMMIRLRL
jgi:hypothetical protein